MNRRQPRLTSAGLLISLRSRVIIMRFATKLLMLGGVALFAAASSGAYADPPKSQATPNNFNYEIKDGSWREEIRQGNCVTVKEMSAAGEYKETRQCGG